MNTYEDTTQEQTPSGHSQTRSGFSGRPPLRRAYDGRMLAGVCAGLADYLAIDVTIVRVAFAVFTFLGGAAIPAYLACLLLIPEEGSDQSLESSVLHSVRSFVCSPAAHQAYPTLILRLGAPACRLHQPSSGRAASATPTSTSASPTRTGTRAPSNGARTTPTAASTRRSSTNGSAGPWPPKPEATSRASSTTCPTRALPGHRGRPGRAARRRRTCGLDTAAGRSARSSCSRS